MRHVPVISLSVLCLLLTTVPSFAQTSTFVRPSVADWTKPITIITAVYVVVTAGLLCSAILQWRELRSSVDRLTQSTTASVVASVTQTLFSVGALSVQNPKLDPLSYENTLPEGECAQRVRAIAHLRLVHYEAMLQLKQFMPDDLSNAWLNSIKHSLRRHPTFREPIINEHCLPDSDRVWCPELHRVHAARRPGRAPATLR